MSVDYKEKCSALLSSTTIDVTSTGQTTLYTVPTGYRCILHFFDFICGTLSTPPLIAIVSCGQVGALTDFLGNQTLSNLVAIYDVARCMPIPAATPVLQKSYAAGTVIQLDVTTADADGPTNAIVKLFGQIY